MRTGDARVRLADGGGAVRVVCSEGELRGWSSGDNV